MIFLSTETKRIYLKLHAFFIFLNMQSRNVLLSAISHHISVLNWWKGKPSGRQLPKSYFKISTFQPKFLCSNFFRGKTLATHHVASMCCQAANHRRYIGESLSHSHRGSSHIQASVCYPWPACSPTVCRWGLARDCSLKNNGTFQSTWWLYN